MLISLRAAAQTNGGKVLCVNPACPVAYRSTDTAKIFVQITTSDGYAKTVWSQPTGQTLTLPKDTTIWTTSLMAYDGFNLIGAAPGTYTVTATVTSSSGSTMSQPVTFTILPPTPACPAPRMISTLQINILGTWIPVPVNTNTVKVLYSDGSTQ